MGCCGEQREGSGVRQCTDVTFLGLFIVFVCLLLFVAAFAFVYGNPLLLVYGYDSFGNICGKSNDEQAGGLLLSGLDMTHRPYLFDLDVNNVNESIKICVQKCPERDLHTLEDLENFYISTGSSLCSYNFNFSQLHTASLLPKNQFNSPLGPCPVLPVYRSDPVLQRCVPSADSAVAVDALRSFYEVLNSPAALEQLLADLYLTWPLIFILSFVSFVAALAMLLLLSTATTSMAIAFNVTVSLATIAGSCALWWTYFETKWLLDETPVEQMLLETATNERVLLVLAVVATIFTLILLCMVIHVARNVKLLTTLFQEASGFIKALPSLYIQPLVTVALLLSLFCTWMYIVLCLATATTPEARQIVLYKEDDFNLTSVKKFTLLQFTELYWVRIGWWLYLVALVWVSELVLSCQQMATAGALVDWYFGLGGRHDGGARLLLTSARRLMWYHVGSVALGSLLIALFKVPRLALRLLGLKQRPLCYERGLRYINHNAYAVIAIEGIDFCPAARVAYQTMESNRLQFSSVNSIGDCFLFLGKCCVTAIVGCVGLLLMRRDPQLHVYAVPLLVLCVFSFYVAHSVFTLYEVALDSLFLCVAEDQALSVGYHAFRRPHMVQALVNLCAKRAPQPPESQPMF